MNLGIRLTQPGSALPAWHSYLQFLGDTSLSTGPPNLYNPGETRRMPSQPHALKRGFGHPEYPSGIAGQHLLRGITPQTRVRLNIFRAPSRTEEIKYAFPCTLKWNPPSLRWWSCRDPQCCRVTPRCLATVPLQGAARSPSACSGVIPYNP